MGGICGMGMAPLALFLKADGLSVRGFDDGADPRVKNMLELAGITVDAAYDPALESAADEYVISSALARRIPTFRAQNILRRGVCLARACAKRRLVAVVGSHGKSSVTAMIAHCINKAERKNCGYLVGALPSRFSPAKYCRDGEVVVAEVDESDGTIENFEPEITVALNADLDHIDQYADSSKIEEMFLRLFARTRRKIILLEDDEILLRAAKASGKPFAVVKKREEFISTNRAIALKAYAEAFGEEAPKNALEDFAGVRRRQEFLSAKSGALVVADYAHHPNEVSAFLKWFETHCAGGRITVVFQPHRYTRTRRFAAEFAYILSSLKNAETYLMNVYPASEPYDPLGSSEVVAALSEKISHLKSDTEFDALMRKKIADAANSKIALVGAGDIYFKAKRILDE